MAVGRDEIVTRMGRLVYEALERSKMAAGKRLIVALSGGADSLAMLHSLYRLPEALDLRLHGAHLDHGLRGEESKADAAFAARTFQELDIPFTLQEADVAGFRKSEGLSLEEAARELRYDFLSRVADEQRADGIALAHTADDQAETVLMHIIRGSGLAGLRGMEPVTQRVFSGRSATLVRPLLAVSREETASYCRALELTPREDRSNLSLDIRRNRVRLELIPLLEQYNPAVREALRRLSSSAARDMDYLEGEVGRVWKQAVRVDGSSVVLDRRAVRKLPAGLLGHLLRRAALVAKGNLRDIQRGHIDGMAWLLNGPAGKSLDLPGGIRFSVAYDQAVLAPAGVDPCPLPPLEGQRTLKVPGHTLLDGWSVTAKILGPGETPGQTPGADGENPETSTRVAYMDHESLQGTLSVRPWRAGDRVQPLGMAGTKKLQDFFVDSKVPRGWRDRVPLVVSSRGIAWVVGWRIAEWARIRSDTETRLMLSFQRSETTT